MSDFKYFGDEWLNFHDFINGCPLQLLVESDIFLKTNFISPNELAYYMGSKGALMNRLKCTMKIKELGDEPKPEDVNKILKEYGLKEVPISAKPNYVS